MLKELQIFGVVYVDIVSANDRNMNYNANVKQKIITMCANTSE